MTPEGGPITRSNDYPAGAESVAVDYRVSDGVCVLRLRAPSLNAIDLELLDQLRRAIERAAEDGEAGGIVITGGQRHFSSGADVRLFERLSGREDAIGLSRLFQEAFQAVEDSSKPVAAALAGHVMGGAVELAAACHLRVAAEGTRFSMPEVRLGINPAAGGTQRLPRLIGLGPALKMLLSGEAIDAAEALALGLVDDVCPGDQLLGRAGELLHTRPWPRRTREQREKLNDAAANAEAIAGARRRVAAGRRELFAPARIVDAVVRGIEESFEAGLAEEQRAFADCVETPAAQNKIYLFFASRTTDKLPELAEVRPRHIGSAAVVGMGTMGTGIAQALLEADLPVVALDEDRAAVERGAERIGQSLRRRVERGRLGAEQAERKLGRLHRAGSWDELGSVDLVIESVFEDLGVKRDVLERLEAICSPQAILATNTSTLSLDELAGGMRHPGRLVGMHFFNPAHRMPLLEVVRRQGTSPEVLATAVATARRLRKTPIVVWGREGFVATRIFVPYVQEAFQLLEEGAVARAIDGAAVRFGFPMGPLELIDMTGLDILVHSHGVLSRAFPWHGPLSAVAVGLYERGHLGQKTGQGVYRYRPGDRTPGENPVTAELVARSGRTGRVPSEGEIEDRLVLRMVAEAFRVLEERVARSGVDVDVASQLGLGFPDFRGGVVRYAEQRGLEAVRARLEELAGEHGARFAPCARLTVTEGGC